MRAAAVAAALVISILPVRLRAQTGGGAVPIRSVEVTGLNRVKEEVARQLILIKPGDSITLGHIDDALHRLWATGQFKDINVVTVDADSGDTPQATGPPTIRFEFKEQPVVSDVQSSGLKNISASSIRDTTHLT